MKARDLLFISDAGHGWLRVPLNAGLPFGTGFGYVDKTYAYLEEDCEAPAFLKANSEIDFKSIPEKNVVNSWRGRNKENIPRNYEPFSS